MSEPEESEDGDRRVFVNLATTIAVLLLAIAAFWLMKTLDDHHKLENCLSSGRRDCMELVEPAAGAPKEP